MSISSIQNLVPSVSPEVVQIVDTTATLVLVAANFWAGNKARHIEGYNKFGALSSFVIALAGIGKMYDRKGIPAPLFYSAAVLNVIVCCVAKVHHYAKHEADQSFFKEVNDRVYQYNPFGWKLENSWYFCGERVNIH